MPNRLGTSNLYGSARLGAQHPEALVYPRLPNQHPADMPAGSKRYELTNHLGNVLSTVSDLLTPVDTDNNNTTDHFAAIVHNQQAYYPFGMLMPGLEYTPQGESSTRYGFNGKENDDEVKGSGIQQDYGMRYYDARLGKFLSVDPLSRDYPWNSCYAFAENSPISGIDLDGLEFFFAAGGGDAERGKSKIDYVRDFELKLNVNDFRRVHAHAPSGGILLKGTASDAHFALNSIYARTPIDKVRDRITDYRIVSAYNQIKNYDKNPETQFNVGGYSFGSVLMAQASIMLLMNDKHAKIDNLVLIGSPISKDSDLFKSLENFQKDGRIGQIHYEYTPGDNVVGAASKNEKEREAIWDATRNDAMSKRDNKHLYFGSEKSKGIKERQRIANKLKDNGVK